MKLRLRGLRGRRVVMAMGVQSNIYNSDSRIAKSAGKQMTWILSSRIIIS
jgi:hypothetical protein